MRSSVQTSSDGPIGLSVIVLDPTLRCNCRVDRCASRYSCKARWVTRPLSIRHLGAVKCRIGDFCWGALDAEPVAQPIDKGRAVAGPEPVGHALLLIELEQRGAMVARPHHTGVAQAQSPVKENRPDLAIRGRVARRTENGFYLGLRHADGDAPKLRDRDPLLRPESDEHDSQDAKCTQSSRTHQRAPSGHVDPRGSIGLDANVAKVAHLARAEDDAVERLAEDLRVIDAAAHLGTVAAGQ
jgi:hypothetical protein